MKEESMMSTATKQEPILGNEAMSTIRLSGPVGLSSPSGLVRSVNFFIKRDQRMSSRLNGNLLTIAKFLAPKLTISGYSRLLKFVALAAVVFYTSVALSNFASASNISVSTRGGTMTISATSGAERIDVFFNDNRGNLFLRVNNILGTINGERLRGKDFPLTGVANIIISFGSGVERLTVLPNMSQPGRSINWNGNLRINFGSRPAERNNDLLNFNGQNIIFREIVVVHPDRSRLNGGEPRNTNVRVSWR